jgi:hypothetical protein
VKKIPLPEYVAGPVIVKVAAGRLVLTEIAGEIFATNASVPPPLVGWSGFCVGNVVEEVEPVT